MQNLENSLAKLYKNTPRLSKNWQKGLVRYLPWINLVVGILALYSAWVLWHWAHITNSLANYVNSYAQFYGVSTTGIQRMGVGIWIGLIILLIEAVFILVSVPALREHKKSGWNLLFYVTVINVVYGVVIMFTSYGGLFSLIESLIGSVIALYFLFQIRDYYSVGSKKTIDN